MALRGPWLILFFDLARVDFYCKFTVKSLGKISENGKISHPKKLTRAEVQVIGLKVQVIHAIQALAGRSL